MCNSITSQVYLILLLKVRKPSKHDPDFSLFGVLKNAPRANLRQIHLTKNHPLCCSGKIIFQKNIISSNSKDMSTYFLQSHPEVATTCFIVA
ncbi:MAG: hypothetical protein DRH12_05660 [Deltaproteobacteria bacterium]|nr:MAG: hypothetical protein DRH12_05660 [Deltaproteobacteria bacterium]